MFGLCMPSGDVYLVFKDGKKENIMMTDLISPRKEILENKYILKSIKHYGYENIDSIVYERHGHTSKVSMAEYYYENAKKLKEEI